MKKKALSDLTKEEIGHLFPIEISPYDSNWPKLYEKERQLIEKNISPALFSTIEHFGSTSVPGLSSKNTIDILMAVEFEDISNHEIIELSYSCSTSRSCFTEQNSLQELFNCTS